MKNNKVVDAKYEELYEPVGNIEDVPNFITIKINNVLTYIDTNDVLDIVYRGTMTNGRANFKVYDVIFQDGYVITTPLDDDVLATFTEEKKNRNQTN